MEEHYQRHYHALGIHAGSDLREMKVAYRRQVRRWHPDHRRNDDGREVAHDQMAEVTAAYRILFGYYKQHGRLPLQVPHEHAAETSHDNALATAPEVNNAVRPDHAASPNPADRVGASIASARDGRGPWQMVLVSTLLGLFIWWTGDWPRDEATAHAPKESARNVLNDPSVGVHASASASASPPLVPGAPAAAVYAAFGAPTRIQDGIWHYDNIKIYFQDGRVRRWDHGDSNASQRIKGSDAKDTPSSYFGTGSTKEQARSLHGNRVAETGDVRE